MTDTEIKNHLIKNGVKNLKEFGYPEVSEDNLMTDEVYKLAFKAMLENNKGFGQRLDAIIDEMISEVDSE